MTLREHAVELRLTADRHQSLLVACHELAVSGGLYRFERFGHAIQKFGHQLAFVAFGQMPQRERTTEFRVLRFNEAVRESWDVTIVPGQGFPQRTIEQFRMLGAPCFGLRVQHILNDQTRKSGFLKVNRTFRPDIIIFNNRDWCPGDFTDFEADAFHYLEGGVDLSGLAPSAQENEQLNKSTFVIGGLSQKNPQPLIEAVRIIGDDVQLRLFGRTSGLNLIHRDLIEQGRLRLCGVLGELELRDFYSSLDCVVHTETYAGWANLVAEGMASGVPVVCTPHGTRAFAEHEVTALVVSEPTPTSIANAIQRLRSDRQLAASLAQTAQQRIKRFSWPSYSTELLRLMKPPRARYYTWLPELELFGKWPESARIAGLEMLFNNCQGRTVLDLGASEGLVSFRMKEKGASVVHGFELDSSRVRLATEICSRFKEINFWQADLSNWNSFESAHKVHLNGSYDIVLYLGLHHYLPLTTRMITLEGATFRTSDWLAIRMPSALFSADGILSFLRNRGFRLVSTRADRDVMPDGNCYLFRRGHGRRLQG